MRLGQNSFLGIQHITSRHQGNYSIFLTLIKTKLGKKRPIVAVDLYPTSDAMRSCVLGDKCSHMRSAVMYVSKDKTLYRSYIITDGAKHVNKNYCLTNKGEVLAEQACWRHFN